MKKYKTRFFRRAVALMISLAAAAAPLTLCASAEDHSFISDYLQTVYDEDNMMPSSEANVVYQTSDGYMWFGGYQGLIRYDGNCFTVFNTSTDDSFPSSAVRDLYEDKAGRLWIATNDSGAICRENGTYTVYDKEKGAPSNSVRAMCEAPDGSIVCGSTDGLFKISPNGVLLPIPLEHDSTAFVSFLECDEKGILYAVLSDNSLVICDLNSGKNIPYIITGTSKTQFSSLTITKKGTIAIGTNESALLYGTFDGSTLRLTEYSTSTKKRINTVYEDNSGNIWIGAENGLGRFDEKMNFRDVDGADINASIADIFEDYEGGYWFASTSMGVLKLSKSIFTDESFSAGFSEVTFNAITKHDNRCYMATNSGLYIYEADTGRLVENGLTGLLKYTRIRDVYVDSSGCVWICTYADYGLVRFDPDTSTYISFMPEDGMGSDKIRCVTELDDGIVAVATADGMNFIKDDKIISASEALGSASELKMPDVMVLSLYYSDDKKLYIGTDGNGLYVADKNGVEHYDEKSGLSGGIILRITPSSVSGNIWVSTGSGLSYINKDGAVGNVECIKPMSYIDVICPGDGSIWLLTTNAIFIADEQNILSGNGDGVYEISKADGLNSAINSNSWNMIDENGRLYICCTKGVNSIDTHNYKENSVIPKVSVTSADIDGKTINIIGDSIDIPQTTTRITIHAALLTFGIDGKTQAEYYLEGQDSAPIRASGSDLVGNGISYTNLPGGEYTFHFRALLADGSAGEEYTLRINKAKALFEQLYVQIGMCVLVAAVLVLGITLLMRMKQSSYLRKQTEYKNIIVQAISAISNTIDAKDPYTRGHSVRVAAYSAEIARRMKLPEDFCENIYYIGLLHDIGKIGIPTEIINKPAKLTDEEYAIMKQHPTIGYEILKDITTIKNIAVGARDHHERYDGTGYNGGLKGEEILLEARIICAADSYDAMSSKRSYRDGLPQRVILEEFRRCRGTQFDPAIADVVIKMIEEDYFHSIDIDIDEILKLGAVTFTTAK